MSISEARAQGDLSENAEYEAAKDRQGFIEGRIQEIESKLAAAQVIDPAQLEAGGKVVFGATVELEEEDTGDKVKYQIVGEDEADLKQGLINISSPIARALIGKEAGRHRRGAGAGRPQALRDRGGPLPLMAIAGLPLITASAAVNRSAPAGRRALRCWPPRCGGAASRPPASWSFPCCSPACRPQRWPGNTAARLFTAQTWVALGCGMLLLFASRSGRRGGADGLGPGRADLRGRRRAAGAVVGVRAWRRASWRATT